MTPRHVTIGDICIYCQIRPGTTSDHVPPKGLFKEPRPSTLITVPCCPECNKQFEKDDDYFLNLSLEWKASETPDGAKVTDKRHRGMVRSLKGDRPGVKAFLSTFVPVKVLSPDTCSPVDTIAFALDRNRLCSTVERTIRGLYFATTGRALPVDCPVNATMLSKPDEFPGGMTEDDYRTFLSILPGRIIHEDVFEFRYYLEPQSPHISLWFLEFYRRFRFLGSTGRPEEVAMAFPPVD